MLELFLNTVTRKWYDKDGDPFSDGMPRGAYKSREDVKVTLCRETPNAGAAGVDVSTWTRDASLASVSGVGALLTIDSDRIHKLKGELSSEVSAGAVSTITATIENASNATVPESGTLRLFDETGDYEAIAYTDRSIVNGEATFTVSGSVSGSYAVGSVIDCDQSPYAQAYLDTSASNLEQGELVFHLVIDSQRLRAEMDYSDVETLSIAGLELLIYRTADGASDPITAYLCETYSVTGTLGSVGNEAQPPDATEDKLAGLVDQLLAAGLDVEQQYDSEGNTQFRVRSVSAGGTWSDWITVQKGEPGADGKSFSVDATGLMSERTQYDDETAGFSFLATDEGNLYIKNSASSGDWSDAIPFQGPAGPANVLTIGTVTTGEPGTQAAASITGESPNQVLNLMIPRGDKGEPGSSGSGSGDMLKSVYDTDNDGKVDAADEADSALNIGGKTASQVASAVDNSHTHSNKTTLDKLGESSGKLTFNGSEVGGGGTAASVAWDDVTGKPSTFPPESHTHEIANVNGLQSALDAKGTVKSVNGVQPDGEGNVTIETGGGSAVDESRLLPKDPEDGDVAIYSNEVIGVNYNDNDTIYYINAASGGTENLALAGVSSGFVATPSGMPAVEDGAWHITNGANQKILFASESNYIKTGSEFTFDFYLKSEEFINSTRRDILLMADTQVSAGAGNGLLLDNWSSATGDDDYGIWLYNTHTPVKNIANGVDVHIAVDVWYENGVRKLGIYVDGVVTYTGTLTDSRMYNPKSIFGSVTGASYVKDLYLYYLRISKIARYKGAGFTHPGINGYSDLPDGQWSNQNLNTKIDQKISTHNQDASAHPGVVRSVNGEEPDEDGNVTIENGAFPDSAVDGDVMMMQEGVDRGNGESTVFLLQPATSNGEMIDSAYGGSTTAQITNTGLTVAENGNIQFTPSTYGVIKGGTLPADVFVPDHEWTLDILFKLDSEQSNNYAVFFGHESGGYSFWAQVKNGTLQFLSTDILYCDAGAYTFGEWALLTVEYYYDETAAAWKHSAYQNGVLGSTSTRTLKSGVRDKDLYIGRRSSGNYYCTGEISVIRVRNTAPYRGKSFTPDDTPYLTPEKAAVPVNMESKISDAVATHNSALNAHPMQFSGETDFNNLTQGGSFYLSAGDSLQNAPATGTFFVIIKNWTSGDITRIFQQVYRLQPDGVHRFYTRHGNKASGAAEITWSSWMMIGCNAFISAPNYGAGVNIVSSATSASGYTCTSAGWIMCYTTQSGVTVTINGNTINNISNTRVFLPVASGDVFKVSTDTTWTSGEITFYPNR